MSQSKVSVIIPVRNEADKIEQCLKAVFSQSLKPYEIIGDNRDETMARDVSYCRRPEDFELFPNTSKAIRLLNQSGFKVIVVTNQSGTGLA